MIVAPIVKALNDWNLAVFADKANVEGATIPVVKESVLVMSLYVKHATRGKLCSLKKKRLVMHLL